MDGKRVMADVWFWLTMCCAALQVTSGALALLLPYRRWPTSHALVYLPVAVHVMSLDASYPGSGPVYLLLLVGKILCASGIFALALADLLSFLELHVHGSAHEE